MKWSGVLPYFNLSRFLAGIGRATAPVGAAISGPLDVPFEVALLERYYSQVLMQYTVTFWLSVFFAVVGFVLIGIAAFLYFDTGVESAVSRFIAGAVNNAIATLFFARSKWAQHTMREFSDKLRRDRNLAEARKMCESIASPDQRDALRIRLALHCAEVEDAKECASSIGGMPRKRSSKKRVSAPPRKAES